MISIAIIDNSTIVRMGLRSLLENQANFQIVFEAGEKEILFKKLETKHPDIILFDYTSKSFSINDIAKIKLVSPTSKTIGITHAPQKEEINEALKNGLISHIKKDCPPEEIIESIEETHNNKHFFCGEVLNELKKDEIIPSNTKKDCSPISLSDREMDVVKLISEGYTNAQIAVVLHISNHTVNTHRKNIMRKLGVGNTAGIVLFAVKTNLVSPDKFIFSPSDN